MNRWMCRQVLECAGPPALFTPPQSGGGPPQSKTLSRQPVFLSVHGPTALAIFGIEGFL